LAWLPGDSTPPDDDETFCADFAPDEVGPLALGVDDAPPPPVEVFAVGCEL
jgi:hypothetical protein